MTTWMDELVAELAGPEIPADAVSVSDIVAKNPDGPARLTVKAKMDAKVKAGEYNAETVTRNGCKTTVYWPKGGTK